jgi:glycosyltransferase involved in cell wall biosynthesis
MKTISIVVPCYNEEAVLPSTFEKLGGSLQDLVEKGKVAANSSIVFVDDGSRDGSWELIEAASRESETIEGIKLSRNRGHQNALLAGLLTAGGDAVVSIDADLQDDPAVIAMMIDLFEQGKEIVYGVRISREKDTWFKRTTAGLFYRLAKWGNPDMVADHADFRLMSRRAIEELRRFPEVNLYLRGMVTLIGFPTATVTYERGEREGGDTKYPLKKMVSFAFDGISSFSAWPLRAITLIGLLTFAGCLVITAWAIYIRFFTERAIPGWASTVLPIYTIGAIQILCIGVVGEYLAKVYGEVKGRPRFIVEKVTRALESQSHPDPRAWRTKPKPER